jgi:protein-disulfide isomerase
MLGPMRGDRRIWLLGGAVVAAVIVAVAAIALGGGSSKNTSPTTTAQGTGTGTGETTTAPARSTFAGIPQHGDTVGKASAPATLIVFEDPQCSYCDEWSVNTMPTVVEQFVRTGKLKLQYRGIKVVGPNSVPGLEAIVAAGLQNRLWQMNEAMYANQGSENSGWITTASLRAIAEQAGVDPVKMLAAMPTAAVQDALKAAVQEAGTQGVGGTPTFFIVRPPGLAQQLSVTSLEPAPFIASLTAALG